MTLRAPGFWDRPPGVLARALSPLGALYAAGTARRLARGTAARGGRARVGVPVICVGNLDAGGTGKTPTVIALIERLAARGAAVHVVSRGHGGTETGPLRVEERRHSAAQVGDEPLLRIGEPQRRRPTAVSVLFKRVDRANIGKHTFR